MNKYLYFISLLAWAFKQPDRVTALQAVLIEIDQLGQTEQFRVGYRQFGDFLREAYSLQVPRLRLERDGELVAEFIPCETVQETQVSGIVPASYSLRLNTGRLLWTEVLKEEDLLWAHAFPSTALLLAADSHGAATPWKREWKLLQEEIFVRVYPGVESGALGIRIDRWKQA
jgi:hypothetical protein